MSELKLSIRVGCMSSNSKELDEFMEEVSHFYQRYAFPLETKRVVITFIDGLYNYPVSTIIENNFDPKNLDQFAPNVTKMLRLYIGHIINVAANDRDAKLDIHISNFDRWMSRDGQGLKIVCTFDTVTDEKRVDVLYLAPELTERAMHSSADDDPESVMCFLDHD